MVIATGINIFNGGRLTKVQNHINQIYLFIFIQTMTHRTLDSEAFARSTVSNGNKRQFASSQKDVLWNVVEPGDPYDIRKSMIANLPGKTNNFMGDNLELVCLLQAAEIERLNQYLSQYQERYIELERRELDRHSYQVQIKELTERLAGENNLRTQNFKLQEHIKKLNIELEDLHQQLRRNSTSSYDSENYQNALQKIESLIQENSSLSYMNKSLQANISRLQNQLQSLQMARSQEKSDYARVSAASNEMQTMKSRYESQIYRLQREIQRLNDSLQMKNHQIGDLVQRISYFQSQINNQRNVSMNIVQYENKIAILTQEIQRLNDILRDKGKRYDELLNERDNMRRFEADKYRTEEELRKASAQINSLRFLIGQQENERRKVSANNQTLEDFQKQLVDAGTEIDRLNQIIRQLNGERDALRQDRDQLRYQLNNLPILERQNQELKRRLDESTIQITRITEYETIINQLKRENDGLRLVGNQQNNLQNENQALREENARLKVDIYKIEESLKQQYLIESANLRKDHQNQIREIEGNTNNRYITQINEIKNRYEIMINNLQKDVDPDSNRKIEILSDEIDRLNDILNQYKNDNQQLRIRNGELERINPQLQEKDAIIRSLERKVQDLDNTIRGLVGQRTEVLTRIRSISQQNEQFKQNHEYSLRDIETLKRQNQNLKQQLANMYELSTKLTGMENQLRAMGTENQRLKMLLGNNDNLLKEIDRLKNENAQLLGQLHEQDNRLRVQYADTIRKVEADTTNKYVTEITNIRNNYETMINQISKDVDPDGQKKIQYLIEELDRLNEVLGKIKEENNRYLIENQELKNQLKGNQDKDSLISALQNRIRDLQNRLRNVEGQSIEIQTRFRSISEENQGFKRNQDYINRERDGLKKQNADLMSQIHHLSQFQQKIKDYEAQIQYLKSEVDRLHGLLGDMDSLKAENSKLLYELQSSKDQQNLIASLTEKIRYLENQLSQLQAKNNELLYEARTSKEKDSIIAGLNNRIRELEERLRNIEGESNQNRTRARSLSQQNDNYKRVQGLVSRDIEGLRRENDELRRKISQLMGELDKAKDNASEIDYLRSQIQTLKKQNLKLNQQITTYSQKLQELLNLQNQYIYYKQNSEKLTLQITQINNTIIELNQAKQQLQSDLNASKGTQNNQQKVLRELVDQLDRLNAILQKRNRQLSEKTSQINQLTIQLQQIKSKNLTIENTYNLTMKDSQQLRDQKSQLEDLLQKANDKNRLLNNDLDRLQTANGQKQSLIRSREVQLQQKISIIESLRRQISEALGTRSKLQNQLRDIQNRFRQHEIDKETYIREIDLKHRKIDDLENDIRNMREQIGNLYIVKSEKQRLEYLVKDKDDQLSRQRSSWDQKFGDLEKSKKNLDKKKKINDINNEHIGLRFNYLEEEVRRLKNEKDKIYNKDVKQLRQETQKLVADNLALKKYVSELNIQIQRKQKYYLEIIAELNKDKDDIIDELQKIKGESNNKIDKAKIKDLIRSINDDTINRNNFYEDEIKRAKDEKQNIYNTYQIQITNLMNELNNEKSKAGSDAQRLRQYQTIIEKLNVSIQQLYKELENRDATRKKLQSQIISYQYKFEYLENENDRENKRIKQMMGTIDRLNGESRKVPVYERKITELTKTIEILNEKNNTLIRETEEKGKKYNDLIKELREYENILQKLVIEHKALQSELERYKSENNQLNDKTRDYERVRGDLSRAESQKEGLNSNLRILNETLTKIQTEKQEIIRVNADQQSRIGQQYRDQYNGRIDQYQRNVSDLMKANSSLKNQVNDYERAKIEISELKRKIQYLNKEIQNLTRELLQANDKANKSGSSTLQLKRTIERYELRIKQLEIQKNNLEDMMDKKAFQAEQCIEKFVQENKELRQKLQKLRQSANSIPQYETKIAELNRTIEELTDKMHYDFKSQATANDRLRNAEEEKQQLRRTIDELKDKLYTSQRNYQTSLDSLSFENNDLKRVSSSIPELNIKTQSLESKISQLTIQVQSLETVIITKDREIQTIKSEYDSKLKNSRQDQDRQNEQYRKLQIEFNTLIKQYEVLKRKAGDSDAGINRLSEEFQRLQTIIEKLKSERASIREKNINLGRQYDRVAAKNKRLEEDNRELRLQIADKMDIQKKMQQQLGLFVGLHAEIQSLRSQLEQQKMENSRLRSEDVASYRL